MKTKALHHYNASELREGLDTKMFSSVEICQTFLNQIKQHNPTLNAYLTVDEAFTLKQAAAADTKIAKGQTHFLTGIPVAQKDIFCTKGIRTTCASKMLENFVPAYNATVIHKFNEAGAVILGKTNMDEFAMGSTNENSAFGACLNPWDIRCIPGGSSGGSAAAVASRLAPIATGTDTGGSIRQPAAFCGLTGIKPTYGRVSRYGMIAFASSFDQAGCFAQTAKDCAGILQTMAGHDPKDSTSSTQPTEQYIDQLAQSIAGKKIGLPKEYFKAKCAPNIQTALEETKKQFEKLGATLVEVSLPHFDLGLSAYYILAPAECSSNLSRFDGVRYGFRCDDPKNLDDLYCRSRNEGFGDEVKRRILIGTYVLSSGFIDAYYRQAQRVRRLIRNDFTAAFEQVDVLFTPATPSSAFERHQIHQPEDCYTQDIFTIGVNLAGLPAITFPVGLDSFNKPLGAQFIGNYFAEGEIMNMVHQFQQHSDWHTKIPEGY